MDVSRYEYIWTTDRDQYVLLKSRSRPDALPLIVNTVGGNRAALVIEDEAEHAQVVSEMKRHGIPVVDHWPPAR